MYTVDRSEVEKSIDFLRELSLLIEPVTGLSF